MPDQPFPDLSPGAEVVVISRFSVPQPEAAAFAAQARAAIAVLAESTGFLGGSLGQATDDAGLRLIITRWAGIGAYRKALSRYDVKLSVVPFLSLAVDEPSAYEVVHHRDADGVVEAASGLAADAHAIGLGSAAAGTVPAVDA